MDELNDTESAESVSNEDNALIQKLRKQVKEASAEVKALRDYKEQADAAAKLARDSAAESAVNALGFPGLAEDVAGWVEGDITEESVRSVLEAKGLLKAGDESAPEQPQPEARPQESPAVKHSQLGQEVANAASGGAAKDLSQKIAGAASREELRATMADEGLVVDYTRG